MPRVSEHEANEWNNNPVVWFHLRAFLVCFKRSLLPTCGGKTFQSGNTVREIHLGELFLSTSVLSSLQQLGNAKVYYVTIPSPHWLIRSSRLSPSHTECLYLACKLTSNQLQAAVFLDDISGMRPIDHTSCSIYRSSPTSFKFSPKKYIKFDVTSVINYHCGHIKLDCPAVLSRQIHNRGIRSEWEFRIPILICVFRILQ